MNWPIQISYATIGGMADETPVTEALRLAKDIGFDGLEPSFGSGELTSGTSAQFCATLCTEAGRLGVPLRTMATGVYWGQSLSDPRAEVRQKAIDFTRDYLRTAQALGVETILVLPGHVAVPWDPTQPVVPYAQVWELATDSLHACVPLAEEVGVNIALENVWSWFLADPIAMRTFVDQFTSERLGVYFDAGNVLINGYPEHWVDILGPRIKAVHVKNFSREDCGGVLHGFGDNLLLGDLNWPALWQALQRSGYDGPITVEMIPFSRLPDLVLPDRALAEQVNVQIRQLLAMASTV